MDVFCVGRIRKSICYNALLGGTMVFISPLFKASCSQIPTLDNNFENGWSSNGYPFGNSKRSCWSSYSSNIKGSSYDLSPSS